MNQSALPLVMPELCYSLQKEVENMEDSKFIVKHMKELKQKNPVVALWIKEFGKTSKDRKVTMICALMVYRMLESQMECDILSDLL